MTITIRDEPSPTPATLIIHMGAGAVESVVSAAVRNYSDYRSLSANGLGMFAVSVFAVLDGVTETEIIEALPQRSFARSTMRRSRPWRVITSCRTPSDFAPCSGRGSASRLMGAPFKRP